MQDSHRVFHRVLVAAWACALSGVVHAEWTQLASRGEGHILFVDRSSAVTNGPLVKVTSLFTYAKPQQWAQGEGYSSTKAQWELNCQERSYRVLSLSLHRDPSGTGNVVANEIQPSAWSSAPESSIPGDLLRWACKGR